MEMMPRNRKGVLLSLVTIVLLALMISELVTYVTININYDSLATSSGSVTGSATVQQLLFSEGPTTLHNYLSVALAELIKYESTPSLRTWHFLNGNSTTYALQSLMGNGTVFGTNMSDQPSGLVGYWKLDEGSGTSAADSSGNGDAGTLVDSPTWVSGKYGGALSFSGTSDQKVTTPLSVSLASSPYTFTAWVYVTGTTVNPGYASGSGVWDNNAGIGFSIARVDATHFGVKPWGSGIASVDGSYAIDSWHFIALVYPTAGSATRSLYVDGNFVATETDGGVVGASNVVIGGIAGYTQAPSAYIDDARVYGRALTPAQITAMYSDSVPYPTGGGWSSWLNTLSAQAASQGLSLSFANGTLSVFQTGPFVLNASYTAVATITSLQGSISFPVSFSTGLWLNGTPSLYGIETGNPYTIVPKGGLPSATLSPDGLATSANTATPYELAYGTAFVSNAASCSSIPAQVQNSNFILIDPNAGGMSSTVCGMAGLITYTLPATKPSTPYLVYPAGVNINGITNGSAILLDGPGLRTLNMTPLQSAIRNGYTYASGSTPSYLDWSQETLTDRSKNGIFSFNLFNRQVPYFDGASSEVTTSGTLSLPTWSFSIWVDPAVSNEAFFLGLGAPNIALGTDNSNHVWVDKGGTTYATTATTLAHNTWYMVTATYDGANLKIYINGVYQTTASVSFGTISGAVHIGEWPGGGSYYMQGLMSNAQIYSSALSPYQVYTLYTDGVDGMPLYNSTLVGWWPMNGDTNDYSGQGLNGAPSAISYRKLNGYQGDAVFDGANIGSNTLLSEVWGALNCGSLGACNSLALPHLYLGNYTLSGTYGAALNESEALGVANAMVVK